MYLKHSFTGIFWTLHYSMHKTLFWLVRTLNNALFWLVKTINNALFWLVSINKGTFLKKPALNQTVFYGIWVKYFLPLTFFFLVGFPWKLSRILNRKGFCVKLMALIWRILLQKGVIFVTFPQPCPTPKPDMLKISPFAQIFQSLWLRKRINFTSTLYESIKVIIP